MTRPGTRLAEGDVLDGGLLEDAFGGCDWVFHLQANADVRHGLEHPTKDLHQNTIATATVLEAMRATGVRHVAFSSTGSVYGEPEVFPTPEDAPFPLQTSLYGASKLAGEGLIAAYAHGFGFTGLMFRFVSVLGERYTHGHVVDFFRALKRDLHPPAGSGGRAPGEVLHVRAGLRGGDADRGRRHEAQAGRRRLQPRAEETVTVDESVATITAEMGVTPVIVHAGGSRGWAGDSPLIHLDTRRIRSLGWKPTLSIRDSIARTVAWLQANPYVWRQEVEVGWRHFQSRASARIARGRRHGPAVLLPRA